MSAPTETVSGVLQAIERLCDVSRLALAAIERDDLGALENCASESEALVRALTAADPDELADPDVRGLLDDVRAMNDRIAERVREERDRTAAELVRVGASRVRLNAADWAAEEDDSDGVSRSA